MKKVIISIIIILVLIAGIFSGLYFFTDIFSFLRPANDNFMRQAYKLMGGEKLSYKEYESNIKNYKTDKDSYTSDGELSVHVDIPSTILSSTNQDLINSSKIEYKKTYDLNRNTGRADLNLCKDDNNVLSATLTGTDTSTSIESKDLYDKELTFDMDRLDSFCSKNNIKLSSSAKKSLQNLQNSISRILLSGDYKDTNQLYDLLYISQDDYKSIGKLYGNFFEKNLDKENFSSKKQDTTVDGKNINTTAYSLTLSDEETYKLLKKLITTSKEDDTVNHLLREKYKVLAERSNNNTSDYLSDEDIDIIFDYLEADLDKFNEDVLSKMGYVRITIYSDKKSNPVKLELSSVKNKNSSKGTPLFSLEKSNGKDLYTIYSENIRALDLVSTDNRTSSTKSNSVLTSIYTTIVNSFKNKIENSSEVYIENIYEKNDNMSKGTVTLKTDVDENILSVNYDNVNSDSELKLYASITTSLYLNTKSEIVYNYDITDLDKNDKHLNLDFSVSLGDYCIKANLNNTTHIGDANIPSISEDSNVDVFSLSLVELQNVINDVVNKASDVLPSKLAMYNINITKEDILRKLGYSPNTIN